MRAMDVTDELLVHFTDPRHVVHWGAIQALLALWEHHAPECLNDSAEFLKSPETANDPDPPWPASRQVPPGKVALARESLLAALAALERAEAKHPSGPSGVVP